MTSTDWCTIHMCKCRMSAYESAYRVYDDDMLKGREGSWTEWCRWWWIVSSSTDLVEHVSVECTHGGNFIKRLVSLMLLLKLLKIIDKLLVRQLIKKEENYEKDNCIVGSGIAVCWIDCSWENIILDVLVKMDGMLKIEIKKEEFKF